MSENSIRPVIVGRTNWLFSDTMDGAEASMGIYKRLLYFLIFIVLLKPVFDVKDKHHANLVFVFFSTPLS